MIPAPWKEWIANPVTELWQLTHRKQLRDWSPSPWPRLGLKNGYTFRLRSEIKSILVLTLVKNFAKTQFKLEWEFQHGQTVSFASFREVLNSYYYFDGHKYTRYLSTILFIYLIIFLSLNIFYFCCWLISDTAPVFAKLYTNLLNQNFFAWVIIF